MEIVIVFQRKSLCESCDLRIRTLKKDMQKQIQFIHGFKFRCLTNEYFLIIHIVIVSGTYITTPSLCYFDRSYHNDWAIYMTA